MKPITLITLDNLLIHEINRDFIIMRHDIRAKFPTCGWLLISEAKWEEEAINTIIGDIHLYLKSELERLYTTYHWNNHCYIPFELLNNIK